MTDNSIDLSGKVAVVTGAAAVAFLPPLFGVGAFDTWFYRGLALLIISCPCALVISTPVSILAALARATGNGVLIKGGAYLEQMAKLAAMAFDKTGTLTLGRPQVTDVVSLNGASQAHVLHIATALERFSEHPLAAAIVEHSEREQPGASERCACGCEEDQVLARAGAVTCACGCEAGGGEHESGRHAHDHGRDDGHADPLQVSRFRAVPGLGVRAEVDGRLTFVGRPQMLGAHADDPSLRAAVERLEREGKTAVAVGDEDGPIGVIAVSDPLRDDACAAVTGLRELGVGHLAMLTGDNPETAAVIARQAGVDEVRAGLLPADKVDAVGVLRERYGIVAMVGDGINDAPALAAADLGIAMGAAGTDAALETADIALMGDDLRQLPATVQLARRTTQIVRQNIVFSLVVKALFLTLAPLGLVSLWLAVFADMGTSLLVTANGLRLYRR